MEDDEIEKNKERESYIALMDATRKCRDQYIDDVGKIGAQTNRIDTNSPIMANFNEYVRDLFASRDYSANFDECIGWIENNT